MSGSLIETLMESERSANRSCAIAALWVAAVLAVICLIGLTGALGISHRWMYFYAGAGILPILAVFAYAKLRDFRGGEIKHLMILVASLVPAAIAVPTLLGFFLMPLPIVVSGRYFSRRLVWETYLMVLALAFAMTIPHAYFGIPCYPLCEEARESLQLFLDGRFRVFRYWRYLVIHCYPSFVLCLSFFTITMSRLCRSHLDALERQAKVNARLADVEKGLVLAAAAQVMSSLCPPSDVSCPDEGGQRTEDSGQRLGTSDEGRHQPEVGDWSTAQIIECISKCKERAAKDPEFAALVERDPAAAVREVQA